MKKIVIALTIAAGLYAKVIDAKAPTQKVQITDKIYSGSFLAVGYLPAQDRYVIDAPVEGVVERLKARIYEPVEKGSLLVRIKSPKILELEAQFIDTLIERDYYKKEVARLKPLYEAAVVAKKVYLKARNMLSKYETKAKFLSNLLIEWGLSKAQVAKIARYKKPLPTIDITAPISGKVLDLAAYPKIYLHRGDHILTIINPKGVHYEVALPVKIARLLKPGQKVFLNDIEAVVESIAPAVDERTQTVAVHFVAPKSSLLPGQKSNVKLYLLQKAYLVPNSAVVDIEGQSGVFVRVEGGFTFVPVEVLGRTEDVVYIRSDKLTPDSEIAVSGVITLKGAWEAGDDR